MDERTFNARVEQLRREPIPGCPGGVETGVLRKIRLQRDAVLSGTGVWAWIDGLVPQARFVVAASAVALLATFATAEFLVEHAPPDRSAVARVALGFESIASPPANPFDRRP